MSRLARAKLFDEKPFDNLDKRSDSELILGQFQHALTNGKSILSEYHLEGGNAANLGKQLSWLIDQLLEKAWIRFFPESTPSPSLIAAGGYGRRELNLESDIDLLILLPDLSSNPANAPLLANSESFIRFCWDIGLKVGHSIRNLEEAIEVASEDLSAMTNMMETRLIHGERDDFERLQIRLRKKDMWPWSRYMEAKLKEQQARHFHFGDTAYNLEPNIKESPGGLRDLHMVSWVANRYFGTSDFAELVEHEFLTPQEYAGLIKCRNFLWQLRNGLHLITGRCEDRLVFDHQRELAKQLGFKQKGNHLAVEEMMKRYYRTVKEVQLLNEITLQHFEEVILSPNTPKPKKLNPRFNAIGNYLEAARSDLFETQPNALLELFYLMQQQPELVGVRASTIRLVRSNLDKIDSQFRKDPENQATFLNIFKHQDGLTHSLRRMNAYGVLGKFFPEFGKIVGQMQHDLFHVFTVDAHSLFVVGNLRKLMLDRFENEFPILRTILSKLNRRDRLYIAALCHDIGKGSGKDHSEVGEKITLSLCKRLGMSEYDIEFVAWLVRNHLIMSWTAQREDTSDQSVIDRFAQRVGDQEHLDNLYLLTVADIRGTSPNVWNEWKGQLLSDLHTSTSRRMRSGISGPEAISKRVEDRKNAIEKLVSQTISDKKLNQFWNQLDQEYFLRNGPETCAWHAQQICVAEILDLPLVAIRHRPEVKAQQILVATPDSDDLLSRSTGAIDNLGLSILDARIHQTKSGLGILVFVTSINDEDAENKDYQDIQISRIREFLLSAKENYVPASRVLPRAIKQFSVETLVTFNDEINLDHTMMEIVSRDRPGLLYHVSIALLECKVRLVSAKVSTVGEKAEDTFFITDRDGNPVKSAKQRKCLESRIKKYLKQ